MKYGLAAEIGSEPWLYPMDVLHEAVEFFTEKRRSRPLTWTRSDDIDLKTILEEIRDRIR